VSLRAAYLICASQRSGTTLLCRALADTGVAGRPEEYFLAEDPSRLPSWSFWEEGPYGVVNGVQSREEYLQLVLRLGTTPNGIFGAKLMWNYLSWAIAKFQEMPRFAERSAAEILHAVFPDLRVVHVTRRDRVGQAVSWARMAQDGVWVVSDEEPPVPTGRPEYRFELIAGMEQLIAAGEIGWRSFFDEIACPRLEIVYEDLVSDRYESTIRDVLVHIGADHTVSIPAPRTHRQADALNDEWVRRYNDQRRQSRR
jgi:LPS sulfotransferase NodH